MERVLIRQTGDGKLLPAENSMAQLFLCFSGYQCFGGKFAMLIMFGLQLIPSRL